MKLRKRLRRIPESVMVVVAMRLIPLLPRGGIVGLSRFLGWCTYRFSSRLRRVSLANLELVFGEEKSELERERICRGSFDNFALVLLDLFWFGSWTERRMRKYVRRDASFDAVLNMRSAIIVSPHLGNWEMLPVACGYWGYPLTSIAMPIRNRFVDYALSRLRTRTGSEIVKREGGLRAVLKSLKSGRGTAVGVDQNTLPEEGGVFVPFFGLPVPVANLLGVLLARSGSKIAVSCCVPDKRGIYTIYARELYPAGDDLPEREEVTRHVTHSMEDMIRAYPERWVWSYKRWRFYREGDPAHKFPYYSESYEGYMRYLKLRSDYREKKAAGDEVGAAEVRQAMQAESQAASEREQKRREMMQLQVD